MWNAPVIIYFISSTQQSQKVLVFDLMTLHGNRQTEITTCTVVLRYEFWDGLEEIFLSEKHGYIFCIVLRSLNWIQRTVALR